MAAADLTSIAVANVVWDQIKSFRSASDDHLSILHFLFGKNFERATRIVDQGGVRKLSGTPSGRSLFLVVGESKRKEEYICFPEHHCTCYSFFYDVVSRGEQLCCKHQLAARLAEAVGAHSEVQVSDEQLAVLLSRLEMKIIKPVDLFQIVLKPMSKHVRLLGLDVGTKYIGLAVSDIKNQIASPLTVLVRKKSNMELIADDVQRLVSELSLAGLVIGYPFRKQGHLDASRLQVEYFVKDLRETEKLDGLYYTYWDEHYTSKCVESLLHPLDLHPVQAKTILDKLAAVGILQQLISQAPASYGATVFPIYYKPGVFGFHAEESKVEDWRR